MICKEFKKNGRKYLEIQCECGEIFVKRKDSKKDKCNKCNKREHHGDSKKTSKYNRLYIIWMGIANRCRFKENYKNINRCKEWDNYLVFKEWALNNGYKDNLTIDRKDNKKDYEPSNCRWIDMHVQANNRKNGRKINKYPIGVSKSRIGNYRARIMIKGKDISLGAFDTPEEAGKAYEEYAKKHKLQERLINNRRER